MFLTWNTWKILICLIDLGIKFADSVIELGEINNIKVIAVIATV